MYPHPYAPDAAFLHSCYAGQREAVFDSDAGVRYSYAELNDRANSLAAFLTGVLGLRKGDRVAFFSENCVAFLDAFFMSCRTGIVITTYNPKIGRKTLERMFRNEEPRVVFYSATVAAELEPFRRDGEAREYIAVAGEADARDRYAYRDAITHESAGSPPPAPPKWEDTQMLIHTGGTTGEPKAAMLSYRALFFNALGEILAWDLTSRDCALVHLPLFHTAGWNVLTLPVLLAGGRVVLAGRFSPGNALRLVADERPTVCMAVETVYKLMARHELFASTDFSCFRFLITGAAPVSRVTLETYWNKGANLLNAYGITEAGPNNVSPPVGKAPAGEIREKWNSIGRPMPFNQVKIVDENGAEVRDGERGELALRGPLTFSGYWRDPETTGKSVKNGWFHTGDIVYRDGDGYLYISGRKKNMYISGGENVYPVEIEHTLSAHPAVEEVCVIGVPDDIWGEVGKALVVLAAGATVEKQALQEMVAREHSTIMVPRHIQFVEKIPKNVIGKLDLETIRRRFGHGADRAF